MNSNQIKIIAVTAMLTDHIAWVFVPSGTLPGQLMHFAGRITAPVMCFFIVEGYKHTRSLKKYILRLLLFALASQIPYTLFNGNKWYEPDFNIFFTLALGLILVTVCDRVKDDTKKNLLLCLCMGLSVLCDWSVIVPLWCFNFYINKDDQKNRNIYFAAIVMLYFIMIIISVKSIISGLFTFGTFLALILINSYNGERGKYNLKWLFYIFYPVHLIIIYIIKISF